MFDLAILLWWYGEKRIILTSWTKSFNFVLGKSAKLSKVLKKVDLLIVPNEECQRALRKTRLGSTFTLHESFICAGGQPGKDTCKVSFAFITYCDF